MTRPPRRATTLYAAVIAYFLLLTALILNGLLLDPGGKVTAGALNDYHLFHWNYWWIGHALFDLRVSPYVTNYVLFPQTHNLAAHTLTPILAPAVWLLTPLVGSPAAMNLILWLTMALTGVVTFLFLDRHISHVPLSLFGATLYAFLPAMMSHAINYHANMWLMVWLPGLLLLWDRVADTGSLRWAAVFGVALWGLWLTDFQFLIWSPFLLMPYALRTLILAVNQRARLRIVGAGVLALIVMLALAFIAPLPALLQVRAEETSPASYATAHAYSMPPGAFLFAPGEDDRGLGRMLIPGTLLALLIRPATRSRSRRWFWLVVALPPLILSLGPDVQIGGLTLALPYRWLHDALGGLYRFPSRFGAVGALPLLVFIGLSLYPWFTSKRNRLLAGALIPLLIVMDGRLLKPLPLQAPLPDYAIYHRIGAEPEHYVVMQVPVTVHSGWAQVGGQQGQRAMWYALTHHRQQVNGSLSRIPDADHLLFQQNPLLGWLAASRDYDPAAKGELQRWIDEYRLGYVVVHLSWLDPARALDVIAFLNRQPGLCLPQQERDIVAFRARWLGCEAINTTALTLNFGETGDEFTLAGGWYPREDIGGVSGRWAQREAALRVALMPGNTYTLRLSAAGVVAPRRVQVLVGGQRVHEFLIAQGWAAYEFSIPADAFPTSGEIEIRFQSDGAADVDERMLAFAVSDLSLHVERI